jgi:hypothetical protein
MTIITNEYKTFLGCSISTQQKAIDNQRDINVDDMNWDEYTLVQFKDILEQLGYEDIVISYSGFWSQGSGASFTCSGYTYKKGSINKLKKEYPQWLELHEWLNYFNLVNKENFYQLYFDITRDSSYYSHSNTVSVNNLYRISLSENEINIYEKEHEIVNGLNKDFMNIIYRSLEGDYEHQTSDDAVKETLISNEYEFNEAGEML